jgi:signal peptidase I
MSARTGIWLAKLKEGFPSTWTLVVAFIVVSALLWFNDRFLFESIQVTSSSMRPTLLANERVWLQWGFIG